MSAATSSASTPPTALPLPKVPSPQGVQSPSSPQDQYAQQQYGAPLQGGAQKILSSGGPVTQRFGNRSSVEHFSGGVNYGTDIGVPEGTQVALPPGKWQVVQSYSGATGGREGDGTNSGYGNSVLVQNMETGEKMRFSHLSQNMAQPGMVLQGGTYIGATGRTGNATGPHLDLEYYDQSGQMRDVLQSMYAQYLDTQGESMGHGGGGNPWDALVNAGKNAAQGVGTMLDQSPIGALNPFNFKPNQFLPRVKQKIEHDGSIISQGNMAQVKRANGEQLTDEDVASERAYQDYLMGLVMGSVGGVGKVQPPTTKILNQIGDSKVLPKQHILGLMNQSGVKQAEKDVLNKALERYGDRVSVEDFAKDVRGNLLPLERYLPETSYNFDGSVASSVGRFEDRNLPRELRPPTTSYAENIYQSPVKTGAGNVHFGGEGVDSYFGHTRTEDLMDGDVNIPSKQKFQPLRLSEGWFGVYDPKVGSFSDDVTDAFKTSEEAQAYIDKMPLQMNTPKTRRVLEVQSDLFQKGRLEKEFTDPQARANISKITGSNNKEDVQRLSELNKLSPYENIWQERLVREEMKKASEDGIKKLQFPTGETAMKIEGLGDNASWEMDFGNQTFGAPKVEDLKVGRTLSQNGDHEYVITDVVGDGRFKAISRLNLDNDYGVYQTFQKNGWLDEESAIPSELTSDQISYLEHHHKDFLRDSAEQFDISNSVDKNNPIYKFYESEMAKYLKKFKAERVTDDKGNEWFEVPVDPKLKDKPVEAFALAPLLGAGTLAQPQDKKKDKKKDWMMQQYSR